MSSLTSCGIDEVILLSNSLHFCLSSLLTLKHPLTMKSARRRVCSHGRPGRYSDTNRLTAREPVPTAIRNIGSLRGSLCDTFR